MGKHGGNQGGRPSAYTHELAVEICRRLAGNETMEAICADEGMPAPSTVYLWSIEDREGFRKMYNQAREAQAMAMADEIVNIADGKAIEGEQKDVQRDRLRVDTRKFIMSKIVPKFADKVAVEQTDFHYDPEKFTVEGNQRVANGEAPHIVAASGGLKG
jgi:hypothetical protein